MRKNDYALIKVLRQEKNWRSSLWRSFLGRIASGNQELWTGRVVKKMDSYWHKGKLKRQRPSAISSHVGNIELVQELIWSAHPQTSVRNQKRDEHFTVAYSARFSAGWKRTSAHQDSISGQRIDTDCWAKRLHCGDGSSCWASVASAVCGQRRGSVYCCHASERTEWPHLLASCWQERRQSGKSGTGVRTYMLSLVGLQLIAK